LKKNGFTKHDLKLLVPHQANLRIIRAAQERLGVDDSKVMVNIDRYGTPAGWRAPPPLRCGHLDPHRIAQVLLRELRTSAPMVRKRAASALPGYLGEDAVELRLESHVHMRSASSRTR